MLQGLSSSKYFQEYIKKNYSINQSSILFEPQEVLTMINSIIRAIKERRLVLTIYRFVRYYYLYYILKDKNIRKYHKWTRLNNDLILRLNYPLTESSFVFDLGGYLGDFSQAIIDKFNCNVFVFEPVEQFYSKICNRFLKNSKVRVFNFGIGNSERTENIYMLANASSVYTKSDSKTEQCISIKNITSDFLINYKINKIDLIKINVEGMEFEILENLIENKLIGLFDNIQIQFHIIDNYGQCEIDRIRGLLEETHDLSWRFDDIWESWQLKKGAD